MGIPTIPPRGSTDPHGENQMLPADRLLSPVLLWDRKAGPKPLRLDALAARHELQAEAPLRWMQGKQPPAMGNSKAM